MIVSLAFPGRLETEQRRYGGKILIKVTGAQRKFFFLHKKVDFFYGCSQNSLVFWLLYNYNLQKHFLRMRFEFLTQKYFWNILEIGNTKKIVTSKLKLRKQIFLSQFVAGELQKFQQKFQQKFSGPLLQINKQKQKDGICVFCQFIRFAYCS